MSQLNFGTNEIVCISISEETGGLYNYGTCKIRCKNERNQVDSVRPWPWSYFYSYIIQLALLHSNHGMLFSSQFPACFLLLCSSSGVHLQISLLQLLQHIAHVWLHPPSALYLRARRWTLATLRDHAPLVQSRLAVHLRTNPCQLRATLRLRRR